MTDTPIFERLPPLPPPDRTMWQFGQQIDHYTAYQMRRYAQAELGKLADKAEAEIERLRAELSRMRADRDCEKRLRKDSDDLATDLRIALVRIALDAATAQAQEPSKITLRPIGWIRKQDGLEYAPVLVLYADKPAPENGTEPVEMYSRDQVEHMLASTEALKTT